MTFYDRKEEVIQITLTKFGRQLYSRGKLKPVYFAFFDDDVLYGTDHAGFSENPSSAGDRIKQSTRIRPLSSRVGADRKMKLKISSKQVSDDKRGLLTSKIGNSDPLTDYNPSWNVNIANGDISSNARTSQVTWKTTPSGTKETIESENIPQINLSDLNCKIKKIDTPDTMAKLYGKILEDGSGITVDMSSGELLVSLVEENSPESYDNFDLELFEVEEVEDDKLKGASTDKHYREVLRPLFFEKRGKGVVDDVLIGDGRGTSPDPSDNPAFASYFLNIEADREIPRNTFTDAFSGMRLNGRNNLRGRNSNILIEGDKDRRERDYEIKAFSPLSSDEIMKIPLREIPVARENATDQFFGNIGKGSSDFLSENKEEEIYEEEKEISDGCDDGEQE